jgi:hypothetical protein
MGPINKEEPGKEMAREGKGRIEIREPAFGAGAE